MFKKINNEKGVALIAALMILMVLTLLGISAILTSTTDMQISNNERKATQGQYAAEAGIEHMMAFLNHTTNLEPVPPPEWGDDFSAFSNWGRRIKEDIKDGGNTFFSYSTTVSYKEVETGSMKNKVAFYNQTSRYISPAPPSGGQPVYVIRSVARMGNYQTQENILEVARNFIKYNVQGAFTAAGNVKLDGNPNIDGRHFDVNGNVIPTGNNCRTPSLKVGMPGIYSSGTVTTTSGNWASVTMNNSVGPGSDRVEFGTQIPTTPWGAMGMKLDKNDTSTDVDPMYEQGPYFKDIFPNWPAARPFDASNLTGNQYFTTESVNANITGNGLLILHNPNFDPADLSTAARLDANTGTFRGIIIADAVSLRGNVNITGAVISLTTLETTATGAGTPVIRYSCEAIERFASGNMIKKLNWRKE